MIVVAKKYISALQLFISRMPKMCAILQLVSAPLNPIPIAEHFRRRHPQCEHSYGQHIYMPVGKYLVSQFLKMFLALCYQLLFFVILSELYRC